MIDSLSQALGGTASMQNSTRIGRAARGGLVSAGLALACALAGCAHADRTVATSTIPTDYHLRHPVVLADARQTLDIFTTGGRATLDDRQSRDVRVFAADFQAHGEGRILAQVPQDPVRMRQADTTLMAIRRTLVAAGLKGDIEVATYRIADPRLAAPVRLSFTKLQARLASRCGDWPQDLGAGADVEDWNNTSYYNLGCASQQTLAAQIDDPRDLERPRAEDPTDVQLRTRAIGLIRGNSSVGQGVDPGTTWKPGYSSVGVIGQQ
jgi:pilus assembly protein CpaD